MKIGILGSRGIPNNYGGFEQFAEYLSKGLSARGHEVWVYSPNHHPYKASRLGNIHIIHCNDPELWMGTSGQFFYDLWCILDSRRRGFDALLVLGYTSSSVWSRLYPKKPLILTNMDGLEWKRAKYGKWVKRFLRQAEKWAVNSSDIIIADSQAIASYLEGKYHRKAVTIPYAAEIFTAPDPRIIEPLGVQPNEYYMLIARLEPENHIEMILQGFLEANVDRPFLVIGGVGRKYGKQLQQQFGDERIRFLGGIYQQSLLNNLRYYSRLYFHGHSVGGTNPSLLEAMASSAPIAAHDNPFNRSVLDNGAFFFKTKTDISEIIKQKGKILFQEYIKNNIQKIRNEYFLDKIVGAYERVMKGINEN